jgi:hypothetical protein
MHDDDDSSASHPGASADKEADPTGTNRWMLSLLPLLAVSIVILFFSISFEINEWFRVLFSVVAGCCCVFG